MDGEWIFIAIVVLIVLGFAYSLFGRRRDDERHPLGRRRGGEQTPAAEGRSEATADEGEEAPVQHGTK